MSKKKVGRPKSVTIPSHGSEVYVSTVKKFTSSSGAYIPMSEEYVGRRVILIVFEEGAGA